MPPKILIVDDSQTIRKTITAALAPAGFDVVEAEDGVDGAEKVQHHADLALVICDLNMPRMNGIEMLTRVKADAKNTKLPVLMLTTEGRATLIREAKKAGACGWMVKPFSPDVLLAAVRKLTGA